MEAPSAKRIKSSNGLLPEMNNKETSNDYHVVSSVQHVIRGIDLNSLPETIEPETVQQLLDAADEVNNTHMGDH